MPANNVPERSDKYPWGAKDANKAQQILLVSGRKKTINIVILAKASIHLIGAVCYIRIIATLSMDTG